MQKLIGRCIEAVQAEINAATSGRSSERSIGVVNGRFQRTADERHVYLFSVTRDMPSSYDDAPVRLAIGGQEIGGSIVGLGEFEVTVALDDYLGHYIAEADLVIDLTFILKKLHEMLEGRTALLASHHISRKAMGFDQASLGDGQPSVTDEELNLPQLAALRRCLGSDFLMVWGPPGTGKTHVLARILREEVLAGRSVLLMSNTNIAVDQALANFLKLCDTQDSLRELFEQGKFVRLGTPQIDDADRLVLDHVIEKLNLDIRQVLEDKRGRLEACETNLSSLERSIADLRQLTELKEMVERRSGALAASEALLSSTAEAERSASVQLSMSGAELSIIRQKRGIGGMLARIAEPRLQKRMGDLTKQSADLAVRVRKLTREKDDQERAWRVADAEYRRRAEHVSPPDQWADQIMAREQAIASLRPSVDVLRGEIAELESRLSGVREQVLRDALLVACTCAKSTLDKVVSARLFDTVVTDESSMISLPQALWCSSLARGRLLCFGDFCQLPPISSIKEEKDPANHRIMHSSVFEQNKIGPSTSDDPRVQMLEEQYRMPAQICELVNDTMYRGKLVTSGTVEPIDRPLTLISTSVFNAWSDKTAGFSWFNWHHAFVVVELVRQLSTKRDLPIGGEPPVLVLSPYRAQVELIGSLLKEAGLDAVARSATVWRSQGREGEIVVLDTVCAPPFNRPGRWFLDEPGTADGARLLNVAVTRAKRELFIVAHRDYLRRHCPPASLASRLLSAVERDCTLIESGELTEKSLPSQPNEGGGYPILTFPGSKSIVYDDHGFVSAFARDLESVPSGSTITVFSPFLNEKSVAHWGALFRSAISRGCRVEIFTRKPSRQMSLFGADDVVPLIDELKSLGAAVGFDTYIAGQRPMHHKIALIRFAEDAEEPIIWKGSMNTLGHYSSTELMDRTRSKVLYDCLAGLLKLGQMQAALVGSGLAEEIEAFLRDELQAVCPAHGLPMRLKFGRNAKFRSYFMGCPEWQSGCKQTIKVDVACLNKALTTLDARCLESDCDCPVEARTGRVGVYLKCADGHFVNLAF